VNVRGAGTMPPPPRSVPELGPNAYAAWRNSPVGRLTEERETAVIDALAGAVTGTSLLDIGCGDGRAARRYAQAGAHVTGIDVSAAMIRAARDHCAGVANPPRFLVGEAEHLPFPDQTFDRVVAVTVLCFVPEPARLFAEAARVLRPGGVLVMGELGRWSLWAAQRRIRAWRGDALWRRAHFRTPGELAALARAAGLVPGPVRGAVYYPRQATLARLMIGLDPMLGRLTTFGAAFLALAATKPA
jgi:SAM-dependent methyltransferase